MMFWVLLIASGVTQLQALPRTLTPGACTTKALPTADNNIAQEFLKSLDGQNNGGWAYKYSSVKDVNEGLSSASMKIIKTADPKNPSAASYTLQTLYQIKSYKVNPPIEDIVVNVNNKLVSKTNVQNKPETEYVILKFKSKAYVYFYKCSNAAGAENGRDARFVLAWNGALSANDKKDIETFDRSLSQGDHKVFNGIIQEI